MAPRTKSTKTKSAPRPRGRPSSYTPEIVSRLCAELACGKSLRSVCAADDMPAIAVVFRWLHDKPEFRDKYALAKAESADALVEEMLDIADDGTNDYIEVAGKDGEPVLKLNAEHVQRSRLRIDTRKWISSKLKPKKYGDKVDMNHGIQPGDPLLDLLNRAQGTSFKPVAQVELDDAEDDA